MHRRRTGTVCGDRFVMSLSLFWRKWSGALWKDGIIKTVKYACDCSVTLLIQKWKLYFEYNPWSPWYCYLDKRFDRRFAVDTAGVLILPEIHSDPRFNGYSPTPHFLFYRLLRQIKVDYSKSTFIDFGCGKGKALLLAARLPFKRIIGVEVSSVLIGIAEDNLETYRGIRRCKTIELVRCDARDFRLPQERAMYYFWDPFEGELMQQVLLNIENALATEPRDIYILYFKPVHRNLLDESKFLTLVKQASWYCIYKS
jgi:SAM-dependent methyltransferase